MTRPRNNMVIQIEKADEKLAVGGRSCLNCQNCKVTGMNPAGTMAVVNCAVGRWTAPMFYSQVIAGQLAATKQAPFCPLFDPSNW